MLKLFYACLAITCLAHCSALAQHDHGDEAPHAMHMRGMLGEYGMSRESSGTAWQPESTPMDGLHFMHGPWMFMLHGNAYLIYDDQRGDRGDAKTFSTNMFMLMAQRPLGPGHFGLRTMLSLEPATIGKRGYPLLLQTGETADGKSHLIDRQHPHDLFMELAATYSLRLGERQSAFVYLGLPGEPAVGPATFMHRFSGMDNPEAPITHHWLDSTHITFGVATIGYAWKDLKLEGSIFTGREPDQSRWDIETPKMDSQALRLTYNPTPNWSAQISGAHINSPEQLEPSVDVNRATASVSYNLPFGHANNWQATLAIARNDPQPGEPTDALLLESAVQIQKMHTLFGRYEWVEKDELFEEDEPLAGEVFAVHKVSVGYIYDFPKSHQIQFGIGALGSIRFIPSKLEEVYGDTPLSFMVFARVKL